MKINILLSLLLLLSIKINAQKPELTLIESIAKTDTLKIYFSSIYSPPEKCGATVKNNIKIFYQNAILIGQTNHNQKIVSATIDKSKLEFLIAVEKESHSYDDPNKSCKSSDGYWYYINDEFKFRIIDQTCEWHGFSKMTNRIFGFE